MNNNRLLALILCLLLTFSAAAPCFVAFADGEPLEPVFDVEPQPEPPKKQNNEIRPMADPTYTVTLQYKKKDGSPGETIYTDIPSGGSVAEPSDFSKLTDNREQFIRWSENLSNITLSGNKTITAEYKNVYTVTFLSGVNDSHADKVDVVDGDYAEAPKPREIDGKKFVGWDTDPTTEKITRDGMVFNAKYKTYYTVTFVYPDGKTVNGTNVIATDTVLEGGDATYPTEAEVNKKGYLIGYDFTNTWSPASCTGVTKNETVTAAYKTVAKHKVTFVEDITGGKNPLSTADVEHHADVTAPTPNDTYVGYKFTGWNSSLKNIIGDMTIKALYEQQNPVTIQFRARINGQKTDTKIAENADCVYNKEFDIKTVSYAATTGNYAFVRWETASVNKLKQVRPDEGATTLTIYALYGEATRNAVDLVNPDLAYSVKQGGDLLISLPMAVVRDVTNKYYSNKRAATNTASDSYVYEYSESTLPKDFDQKFVSDTTIESMRVKLVTKGMPFTTGSMSTANGDMLKTFVVQRYSENANYYKDQGFTEGVSINLGMASFALKVDGKAKVKTHEVPFEVSWTDDEGDHKVTVYVKVKVTKKSSSSSSSGGGGIGGTGTEKPLPTTRFYIDNVRTMPANPKAGEPFTIYLRLVNKNEKLYLHNLDFKWSAEGDVLLPAGEATNVIYIPKIDADSTYDVEIPVESLPEIPNKLVKVDVDIAYQDKKMADGQLSQNVIVQVQPVQRMTVDELKLPTTSTLEGEDFEIKVSVANKGKTTLYNLTANVISDNPNLIPGQEFYGGNVDPASSKTIEVLATPLEAGNYEGAVEIVFEDENGEKTTERREFSFTAQKEDSYDDPLFNDPAFDLPPPEPEQVNALSVMAMLPMWLYGAMGLLILLIIVSMAVSARKRRRRANEEDEMD